MYCQKCGSQNNGANAFCTQCGARIGAGGAQATQVANSEVKSHMVGAILQLVVCLPAGIVPLIYACKVNKLLIQGDIAGAQEASKKALLWINIGTAIFGTLIVLSIICNLMSKG